MKRKFWNSDKIVSFSAIFISIATLYITINQYNATIEQQRLSVLPYLTGINFASGTPDFAYVIENNGIGPAFIESVKVTYQGKTYEGDLYEFMVSNFRSEVDSLPATIHSNIFKGMMIPAGAKILHLQVNGSQKDTDRLMKLLRKLNEERMDFEIIYSSIYKERWRLNLNEEVPQKLD